MESKRLKGLMRGFTTYMSGLFHELASPSRVKAKDYSRISENGRGFEYYPEMVANDYY